MKCIAYKIKRAQTTPQLLTSKFRHEGIVPCHEGEIAFV